MGSTTLGEISNAVKDVNAWLKKQKGDSRLLVAEIKNNLIQLDMVVEHDVNLEEVLNDISIKEYKRLQGEGFNFGSIKKSKIPKFKSMEGTDLESWMGKETEELISSIYDKIIALKTMFPRVKNSSKIRWNSRVINIRKRILLFLRHLGRK